MTPAALRALLSDLDQITGAIEAAVAPLDARERARPLTTREKRLRKYLINAHVETGRALHVVRQMLTVEEVARVRMGRRAMGVVR